MPTLTPKESWPVLYEVRGAGEMAPVVLLGGPGVPHSVWAALADALAADRRVLQLVHRGHRPHERCVDAADAPAERVICDLQNLVDAEGGGPVHLVAWCAGTRMALAFADHAPDSVATLLLLAPALSMRRDDHAPDRLHASLLSLREAARARSERRLPLLLRAALAASPDPHTDVATLRALDDQSLRSYLELYAAWQAYETEEPLARLDVPTSVLAATADTVIPPSWLEPWAQTHLPSARYREVAGEHEVFFHAPAETAAVLVEELAAWSAHC
jgi:pimeloyl-ACP methyl ester carboxylesterase